MKLKEIREKIDLIDSNLLILLAKRLKLANKVKLVKKELALPLEDTKREKEILTKIKEKAKTKKLRLEFVNKVFAEIIKESKREQEIK